MLNKIYEVLQTLDKVKVEGRSNMTAMLGAMWQLEEIARFLQEEKAAAVANEVAGANKPKEEVTDG